MVTEFLRGVLPSVPWSAGSRLPAAATAKMTIDTIRAARVPAGVHLAFTGSARAVELTVRPGERTSVPSPALAGEAFVARVPGQPVVTVPLPADGQPADGQSAPMALRVPLPERDPDTVVRLYLPEAVEVQLTGLSAVGGNLVPAPRGPLWVVYGDSISQGWSVTEPGLAWPSLVAADLGLDLVNLGFAGSARGELLAADAVGASGADAVALAWGTNSWLSLPTDATMIAGTMRLFLTALRQGLPDAPVVVVSPIVRPRGEDTANRFGASLRDLRAALEDAVLRFAADAGDQRLTLVPGRDLVPAGQLVDGIHPGDEGQRSLADGVRRHVAAGLGLAAAHSHPVS
ncbi:MAG: GDSL-type esterase/lipase family protein [Trebonia sp.]